MTTSPTDTSPTEADRRQAVVIAVGHASSLLRYAARFTPTLQDAEDAYQRAMLIALTKAPTVETGAFMAWLHTVLRNEAIAVARSQSREGPGAGADVADTVAETEEAPQAVDSIAAWRERYRALHDALEGLTDAQRICLILQSAGESYDRIEAITGYSRRKVERSVLEGRRALRRWQVELIEGAVCERMGPLIDRTVSGDADRRERRRVSKHVAHCGACRARLRSEREMRVRLGALAPLPLLAAVPIGAPDPSPALAWWDRITQGATVHTGTAVQTLTDISSGGLARIGAGAAAVALAGVAGLPLVVDAVDRPTPPPKPPSVRVLAARTADPAPAITTPARPATGSREARRTEAGARAPMRARRAPAPRPAPAPVTVRPAPVPATPAPRATTRAVSPPPSPSSATIVQEFGP